MGWLNQFCKKREFWHGICMLCQEGSLNYAEKIRIHHDTACRCYFSIGDYGGCGCA